MMAVRGAEEAYITLLLSDNYLPGALVLAHSLRDAGTTRKLAVMVTLDTVAAEVITQLQTVYDYVIPVPRIRNQRPANLYLMNRPDLHSAFTKINLWKQTQFSKLVYIDADVVAYRAPDELFAIEHPFSAAPDIGWPDLFNTGVMVLKPNMGDYYAMMAMAERGISFDGADQGLLNMHFRNTYNRLSFTYNVTPSAHYQYVPAYRHFQSSINMVHFIGAEKPWIQGRHAGAGSGPFDEMVGRWWAVYDRHYRAPAYTTPSEQKPPQIVQYYVQGEYQPKFAYTVTVGGPHESSAEASEQQQPPHASHQQDYVPDNGQHNSSSYEAVHFHPFAHEPHESHERVLNLQAHDSEPPSHSYPHNEPHGENPRDVYAPGQSSGNPQAPQAPQVEEPHSSPNCFSSVASSSSRLEAEAPTDQVHGRQSNTPPQTAPEELKPEKPQPPPMEPSWDAQWQPPPPESKPEAMNFPKMHYEMSSDTAAFVPPPRYPTPPKDMYYQVPQTPPAPPEEKPRPIFPWEDKRPAASRVFFDETVPDNVGDSPPNPLIEPGSGGSGSQDRVEQSPMEPQTIPTGPPIQVVSDPWETFTLTNAWDDMPEINRYVGALQKIQKRKGLGASAGLQLGDAGTAGEKPMRLTQFPSEADRPSLPVTPAPIRRRNFWEGGSPVDNDGEGIAGTEGVHRQLFPAAEGVPGQADWVCVHGRRWTPADCPCNLANALRRHKDPVEQLQKLAKQQSELLLQKLGGPAGLGGDGDSSDSGGEVERGNASSAQAKGEAAGEPENDGTAKSPRYITHSSVAKVHSPVPVRKSPVQGIIILGGGEKAAIPRTAQKDSSAGEQATPEVAKPSYLGPGIAWEKEEDVAAKATPMPAAEEEMDIFDA